MRLPSLLLACTWSCACAAFLPAPVRQSPLAEAALLPPLTSTARRRLPSPRCRDAEPDVEVSEDNPLGGPLDQPTQDGAPPEFVRPPPEYPDGLHDAAKADRSGPFWSSLGEPDDSTGVRPSYLRRDDWHISSTYSAEERAAVNAAEAEYIKSVAIETPVVVEEDELTEEELFGEKEFMKLDPEPIRVGDPLDLKSKLPMPQSWQEYQAIQNQLAAIAARDGLSETDRAEARRHEETMADFYLTFKDILAGGWSLLLNVEVEESVKYVIRMKG